MRLSHVLIHQMDHSQELYYFFLNSDIFYIIYFFYILYFCIKKTEPWEKRKRENIIHSA